MSMLLDKTIRLFLDSIGRRDEYEFYLERFKLGEQAAFAVLVPEYEGFAECASVFVFDLKFLLRLGLHPIVLLCGPQAHQMASLLRQEEHPFEFLDLHLRESVEAGTLLEQLPSVATRNKIAVLVDGGISNEHGLGLLVPAVTRRIHFIRAAGPLHSEDGTPLLYYRVQDPIALVSKDAALALLASRLVGSAEGLHVSVASPLDLLAELFTVKGAGCLIRRGARINQYASMDEVDRGRLLSLLEGSFARRLIRPDCLDRDCVSYIDQDYRCAALLEPFRDYMYLSKFAVQREARGEGLAQELWRSITEVHPSVFWRSRLRNPFNHWYDRQAEGMHTENAWRIYWRGVQRFDIPDVIAFCMQRPQDFADEPLSG